MSQRNLANQLGERIRQLRQERGLSLSQLAHESEPQLTRFHLSHIELGQRLPSIQVLCGLAERLEIEPFELLLLPGTSKRTSIAKMVMLLPPYRQDDLHIALEKELSKKSSST